MAWRLTQGLRRGAVLIGIAAGVAVSAAGTTATLYWVSDSSGGMLDPYKVAGTWIILGAIVGRIAFNLLTPKPFSSADSSQA